MPLARPPAPALAPALATLLLCLASTPVQARPPATSAGTGDSVAHTVQRGDTLEGLARQYLNAPQQWPLLQQRNAVLQPRRLRPGSVLHIPAHLLPEVSAHLEFVQGDVRRSPGPDNADAPPLQLGSALPEGTRLQVGAHSFITVRLADGSVVRVPAQSQVQLRQMRRIGRTGQVRTLIELHSGGLDAEVPASRDGSRHFEIRTPRAATSVRGTRFGVLLASDGRSSTSVLEGTVAVQALAGPAPMPGAAASPAPSTLSTPSLLSGTHLAAGQGVAVGADGALGAVRRLLPAPDLSALPATLGEAGMVALALGPQGAIDQAVQEADTAAQPAALYQVQIARDGALQQVLRNGIFAADAIRLPGLEDGSYVLAVRALDGAGLAGPFAQRPLTVKTQPVAPLYQSPLPGATVARSGATLRCTGVPGIARFHVQVAARADFAELVQDAPAQPQCLLELRTLAAGSYYWRAASVRLHADASTDTGPFAAPQPFTVAERPTPLSPQALQNAQHAQAQQLYWPAQPGQSFRLQCARDATFATLACDETLHQPHWNITGLAPGRYWVRLQTHDPSGLVSDFSAPRHLHVGASGLHTSDGLGVSSADGQPVGPP